MPALDLRLLPQNQISAVEATSLGSRCYSNARKKLLQENESDGGHFQAPASQCAVWGVRCVFKKEPGGAPLSKTLSQPTDQILGGLEQDSRWIGAEMLLSALLTYLAMCSHFHSARLLLGVCSRDARAELEKDLCARLFARCVLVAQQSTGQCFS